MVRSARLVLGIVACSALGNGMGFAMSETGGEEAAPGRRVAVSTDRARYVDGDRVEVRIRNRLDAPIHLEACPLAVQRLAAGARLQVSTCWGRGSVFFQRLPSGAELNGFLGVPAATGSSVQAPAQPPVSPIVRRDDLRDLPPAVPPRSGDPPRDGVEGGGVSVSGLAPGTYRLELRFQRDSRPRAFESVHSAEFVVAK
jgi:hypothetical protein